MRGEREKRLSEILDRSPILTKFLDPTNNDFNLTLRSVEPYLESVRNRIGKNKSNSVVHPLATTAYISRILSNNVNAVNTFKVTELLVLIGIEVGNLDDVYVFKQEILQKLGKLKVFTNGRQYLKEESNFIFAAIKEGTKLKKMPEIIIDVGRLDVYERFFEDRPDLDLNLP